MKNTFIGKHYSIGGLLLIMLILIGCEATVSLNNPIDPEADSYVGYEVGDKDGDGVSDLYDVDFVNLQSPANNFETRSNTIELRWYIVKTASRYHLQIATDSTFTNLIFEDDVIPTNHYTKIISDTGDIYWRVKAGSADRWGESWSETRMIRKLSKIATLISPADASSIDDETPLFTWDLEAATDEYELMIATGSEFGSSIITSILEITGSKHTLNNALENNATYYWKVRAKMDGEWQAWSEVFSFTIAIDISIPHNGVPSTGDTTADTLPLLSWDLGEVSTGYHLQISALSDFSRLLLDVDTITDAEYQVLEPLEVGEYYWRVKAKNVNGVWGNWGTWNFTIDIPSATLLMPGDNSTEIDTTPKFTWSVVADAVHYHLYIDDDADFGSPIYDRNEIPWASYTLPGGPSAVLSNNQTYYWKVAVVDKNGIEGAGSAVGTFTVALPVTTPSAPANNAVSITTDFRFWWDSVSIADRYHLLVDDDSDFGSPVVDKNDIELISYALSDDGASGLDNNQTYYWKVAVIDEHGVEGDWSDTWNITIAIRTTQLSMPLHESDCIDSTPTFEWESVSQARYYHLIIDDNAHFGSPVFDKNDISTTTYTLSENLPQMSGDDQTYYWKVAVVDGNGVEGDWTSPRTFVLTTVDSIALGDYHTLVYSSLHQTVWGAGANGAGELGTGDSTERTAFEQIADEVSSIACGQRFSFIIKTDGSLWGTGTNTYGQLGIGYTFDLHGFTRALNDVVSVSCSNSHTLALKTDGTLWGAGKNNYGQLGTNKTTDEHSFIQILSDVESAIAASWSSFALKTDGTLWATGYASSGHLGLIASTYRKYFTQVLTDVRSINVGGFMSYAIKTDGSLWVSGSNSRGQLGIGDNMDRFRFTQALTGVDSVAIGSNCSFVLKTDGTLLASGYNYRGHLGTGDTEDINTYTEVLTDVKSVVSGASHTLALKTDGTVWAVGSNDSGQLGAGDRTHRYNFTQVLSDVNSIDAGSYCSYAIKTDGSLWVAGSNLYGKLGLGDDKSIITFTRY